MSHLLLVTLGPVQEFIAAARRTRDLWYGSWLLSELSRTAARTLAKDEIGATLIFPADAEHLDRHEVVNRIMAELPSNNDPAVIGRQIEQAIKLRLGELRDQTFNDPARIRWPTEQAHRDLADRQVDDLLEIFWASAPIQDDRDYANARRMVETALAARKNTRNFAQVKLDDAPRQGAIPKSSIDGARESVIPEDRYPERRHSDDERREKIEQLFKEFGAKQAERLSGVDLLKRHGRRQVTNQAPTNGSNEADFPSTSHFAALPFLERTVQASTKGKVTAAFKHYRQGLENLQANRTRLVRIEMLAPEYRNSSYIEGYDASILFESRLAEEIDTQDTASLQSAQRMLQEFFALAASGDRPDPYYALLHADGDNMGKAIDHLATEGAPKHRDFSTQLDSFASRVDTIVKQHHGALVYAGGDDVLAFLPLHTVLQCAHDLADEFRSKLEQFTFNLNGQQTAPTLSVGIAIAHHLEPLSDTLDLARGAEKAAKKTPGKNGLAITLSKRGGGDRTISGSWQAFATENNNGFFDRLTKFTEWHRSGAIPDSAAYDLHNLIERMGNTLPPDALKAEAVRIVKRKRGQSGRAATANAELVKLAQTLPTTNDKAQSWNVAQFANELIVTREFAKAQGYSKATEQPEEANV